MQTAAIRFIMRVILQIFLIILAVLNFPAYAIIYYVSPDGDNGNSGTDLLFPLRTIHAAAQLAVPGDAVYIKSGIYRETIIPAHNGTDINPILYSAYPGDYVLISGCDEIPSDLWFPYSNGVYKASVSMNLDHENQVFFRSGRVSRWQDLSGNGKDAVTLDDVCAPVISAEGAVCFDGVDDYLDTTIGSLTNGGFLMVGNFSVQGADNASVVLSWQTSGSEPGTRYNYENYSDDIIHPAFGNMNGGDFHTYCDGVENNIPDGQGWHLLGGTVEGNGTDSEASLRIGGNHNGSNFPKGKIRELLIWNGSISEEERQIIEGYLAHKHGIASLLPASHPYKENPPKLWDPFHMNGLAGWYDAASALSDGKMMLEARWPNSTNVWAPVYSKADTGTTPSLLLDSDLPDYDWTGASIWIRQSPAWSLYAQKVLDYGEGRLITTNASYWDNHSLKKGSRYYVQGCLDALDVEGEWFYNTNGILYVHAGDHLSDGVVEYKSRPFSLVLDGCSYLAFSNLHILGSTISMNYRSSHITLDRLDIQYPYLSDQVGSGISSVVSQQNRGVILAGNHHVLKNSEVAWSSGTGVGIYGDSIELINNYIHDCNFRGAFTAAPLAIANKTSAGIISHNTISVSGRDCVSFPKTIRNFLFLYNDLSHAGQLTQDLGMTYGGGVEGGRTQIRYNWVHDNDAASVASGIYFDHGSRNLLIHHNVIWGIPRGGIHINHYAMGILMFNNTVTADDGASFLSAWGSEWPPDAYGCMLMNNVFSSDIYSTAEEIDIAGNSTNYSALTENRFPTAGSEPIDSGLFLSGITDEYNGSRPDKGAYESEGDVWSAGHSFRVDPFVDRIPDACPYLNPINNSCFEWDSLSPWTSAGSSIALNTATVNQNQLLTNTALAGVRSIRMGSGVNRIEQIVSNLMPNAVYEFRSRLRADEGASVCSGIIGFGGDEVKSDIVSGNAPYWSDTRISFKTGLTNSLATVYVEKLSLSAAPVYVDDLSLLYKDGDFDGNGISDRWERQYFGESFGTLPADDTDGDGANNLQEYRSATDPLRPDTDDDGIPDGWELANRLNPLIGNTGDSDNDGLLDYEEYICQTDPQDKGSRFDVGYAVASRENSAMQIKFLSSTGPVYQIEFTTNMLSSDWQP
ncbi:MAG: right-handed parallel beta-helix repeat-containing protein, partial [Kiritimatiellales bacterium]